MIVVPFLDPKLIRQSFLMTKYEIQTVKTLQNSNILVLNKFLSPLRNGGDFPTLARGAENFKIGLDRNGIMTPVA